MKAKKILILLAILPLLTHCSTSQKTVEPEATAQTSARPDRARDMGAQREAQQEALIKKLNLTAQQEVSYRATIKKYDEETKAFMEKNRADRQAMISTMNTIQKNKDEAIEAILTPEQFQVYLAELDQQPGRQRGLRPSLEF